MKVLSVARSFGDHFLKKYVTAEPFCPDPVIIESAAHCPFFIIACDGKTVYLRERVFYVHCHSQACGT